MHFHPMHARQFQVQNKGVKDASALTIELPFDGFYKIERAGQKSADLRDFQKTITLGDLSSLESLSVLVWTENSANADFERASRIVHKDGAISIEYPVLVDGFLAWLQRSKAILSFLMIVMILLYLL